MPEASDDRPLGLVLEQAIDAAIQTAVQEHEGGFVTKWLGLVESVSADGTRGLWTMASADISPWDVVGLLQHGMHLQQKQILDEDY